MDKSFELRQKIKNENNDVLQFLVKVIMNSIYGEQLRSDIEQSYQCKLVNWMMTEYDESFRLWKKEFRKLYRKIESDNGLENELKKLTPCIYT